LRDERGKQKREEEGGKRGSRIREGREERREGREREGESGAWLFGTWPGWRTKIRSFG